jgi:hypothetical protein
MGWSIVCEPRIQPRDLGHGIHNLCEHEADAIIKAYAHFKHIIVSRLLGPTAMAEEDRAARQQHIGIRQLEDVFAQLADAFRGTYSDTGHVAANLQA